MVDADWRHLAVLAESLRWLRLQSIHVAGLSIWIELSHCWHRLSRLCNPLCFSLLRVLLANHNASETLVLAFMDGQSRCFFSDISLALRLEDNLISLLLRFDHSEVILNMHIGLLRQDLRAAIRHKLVKRRQLLELLDH